MLYVERLRRRMRVLFGGVWVAESDDVLLLFEPARYPVAYFPESDISAHVLERTEQITQHPDLGSTSWYTVRVGEQHVAARGAWHTRTSLPMQQNSRDDWRSHGAPWMPSMKKTNESWVMLPTHTIA
ncbi:DUF427 domain-containing protein [Mesorhizobium sp. ORM16]|uniref:DUF427 domain-containing protein n=1 Tax=Mesorhizobium sp. ORM16 TaxID=3376989 RepID=UPI0038578203